MVYMSMTPLLESEDLENAHDYLHFADSLGPITFCAVIYRTTARRLEVVALVTARQLIGEQTAGGGRKVSSDTKPFIGNGGQATYSSAHNSQAGSRPHTKYYD